MKQEEVTKQRLGSSMSEKLLVSPGVSITEHTTDRLEEYTELRKKESQKPE